LDPGSGKYNPDPQHCFSKVDNTDKFWQWIIGDNRKLLWEVKIMDIHPYLKAFGKVFSFMSKKDLS
jgi:hypothetical protein